jgi:hypothetical protein
MSANSAVGTTAPERDPIADARALVAMAITLGQRTRTAHRLGQVTDRKASLYVNALVRHAARLLQSNTSHDVPVLRAGSNGPGGNAVHYVVRHDRMVGPPSAVRFLTVGSDARLRCCVVADHGGARIWADYDVSSSPEDLSLRVVLDALSEIVARLEQSVIQLESRELAREAQLEADIATSKARIAGLPIEAPQSGKRQVESEEPIRPWTRHLPAAAPVAPVAPVATVATDVASDVASDVTSHIASEVASDVASEVASDVAASADEPVESIFAPPTTPPPAPAPSPAPAPEHDVPAAHSSEADEPPRRRGFRLKRLDRAI